VKFKSAMGFAIDPDIETTWEAVRFGPSWNGWATPVVTSETLRSIAEQTGAIRLTFDTDSVLVQGVAGDGEPVDGDLTRINADSAGNFDLTALGWCFINSTTYA
jgi:hypothetical protein